MSNLGLTVKPSPIKKKSDLQRANLDAGTIFDRVFLILLINLFVLLSPANAHSKDVGEKVISDGDLLTCDTYKLAELGFSKLIDVPLSDLENHNQLQLRYYIYRSARLRHDNLNNRSSNGKNKKLPVYRDLVIAYHFRDEGVLEAHRNALKAHRSITGNKSASVICQVHPGKHGIRLHRPFANLNSNESVGISVKLVELVFDVFLKPSVAGQAAVAKPPVDDKTDQLADLITSELARVQATEQQERLSQPTEKVPYAWVNGFELKSFVEAEDVFVLDRLECSTGGNFIVGSVATVVGRPSDDPAIPLQAKHHQLYAANHYLGLGGDVGKRSVVENSIDPAEFWCIPKKEFCYKKVGFDKFGMSAKENNLEKLDRKKVYNLRLGLVSVLQSIVSVKCYGERE